MARSTPPNMMMNPRTPTNGWWMTTPTKRVAYGRDEIGVVLVETPLHLFQETLLLLGKWHPDPLRLGLLTLCGFDITPRAAR
jgi:hypothetical protein